MDIEIKLINNDILVPKYQTEMSAGLDLHAVLENKLICVPNTRHMIRTGISINMKDSNMCGIILPRSGLSTKHGIILSNTVGLIDADYQGEIMLSIWNSGTHTYIIEPNERIAQLVFMPIVRANIVVVDEFNSVTKRGKDGFGSTGKKPKKGE